ncbi:hypothetical protein V493_05737 [Pseudogymnoascus sp. VKM F-4281 (FW-2241)]|nr:hypothetical protein V493_05737 [Pseudogymnoascus sp. VKM F-4281 (FW-2241)]
MPSFSKLFLAFGLTSALAPFASAVPVAAEKQPQTGTLSGVPNEIGTYNPSDPLSKRAVPGECNFGGRTNDQYSYYKPDEGDDTCIGWDTFGMTTCKNDRKWREPDIGNIKDSLNELLTKDGQWETVDKGPWTASFSAFTTAFADRNTEGFVKGLDKIDIETTMIYWRNKGDTAVITRDGNTCR